MGAHGQLTRDPNLPSPETKYKRSQIVFVVTSIALTLVGMSTMSESDCDSGMCDSSSLKSIIQTLDLV